MSRSLHLYDPFDSELCLIGAPNDSLLAEEVKRVTHFLEHAPDALLQDVAYTCACSARCMPSVIAVVASSVPDLRDRLRLAHKKLVENAGRIRDKSGTYFFRDRLRPRGRIAFLFPGAVSFYPDMLRDLCLVFEDCRGAFDELEEALQTRDTENFSPSDYVFPPAACYRNDVGGFSAHAFSESFIAIHAANTALYRLFERMGITPDGLAGFSGGDFAALEVAGVYGNLSHNKRVVFLREGYQMLNRLADRDDLPACTMLSVIDAPRELLDALLDAHPGRMSIACFHSPRQQTIALSPEIQKEVTAALHKAGVKTMTVPVDRPFNTPWCSKVLPPIKQFLSHWVRHVPKIPVYSCATAERLPSQPRGILHVTADQWTSPIRFDDTIRQMYEDGFRVFIELGARGNMTNAIDETLKNQPHQAVAVNRIHRSGLVQLHHALGMLAAQGVQLDLTMLHRHRRQHALDFDKPLSVSLSTENELRLSAQLPSLKVFSPSGEFLTASRATAEQARKAMPVISDKRSFDFGADFPMLANAEIIDEQPGVLMEIAKVLTLEDYPFLSDYALGTTQLSYANPDLKGLTLLSLISGMEMMCEAARKLVPHRRVGQVDNLRSQRWVGFERGALRVILRAERISWPDPQYAAVRVQLRDDSPNSAFTWPIIEATVLLTTAGTVSHPIQPPPLTNPRPVNWSGHDIYPDKLFHGERLRIVRHVDLWSEEGIDFEVEVPGREDAVRTTRIPLFSVWPMLLDGIVSGFSLWRSHEKFAGAISMPFRARRIIFYASSFTEGTRLRGYLRLISVTPRSHVADIQVSDGNGNLLIHFRGWEELCERVPPEYHQFILRPSEKFLTRELPLELLGNPATPVAASVVTDVPCKIFENNQELWLRTLANVLLAPVEREEWLEMQSAVSRRVEWLFGRAAAKEAIRRFLQKYHQARWTDADIPIWADDSGKPHPLGPWHEHTAENIDLSIAHTSKLVVAAVAANARIGIDIEALGRDLSEDFTKGVFTHEEMELAAHTGEAPTAILRFWCAKEALSKALGTGIRYSPQDLRILSIDPVTGEIRMELLGQWLESFKHLKGHKAVIHSSVYSGHVFASCLLPASLFEGD
ncbi:MAG TPA: acyltransferase domain-containing protein [Kiritimatiellia bacterium]|nr:acyltransferase domain-containing protein [Kiritimatiellia bacterium]HPS08079.1 acyltransferase domain-containing protein [Kiritimatiellia bacterium]